jgi:DNA-binding MarR family transcriptional regulator
MSDEKARTEGGAHQFILENIDSVPQLEGLVLLWQSRPRLWTASELAARLYISPENAIEAVRGLIRIGMVAELAGPPVRYSYVSRSAQQDELMLDVQTTYQRELVRISHMIHSKASPAVREFARAFRFKKEQDS